MKYNIGLSEKEQELIQKLLSQHTEVTGAILFGSRAKGTAMASSDIDLAIEGLESPLQAEAIASELEELPLPYRFDVKALTAIQSPALREHIERVGLRIYG
ncbi:MAG: nucleotidyltransferase domain-containing protein [Victivallales bacterium]